MIKKSDLNSYKREIVVSLIALALAATHSSGLPRSYDFGGHLSRIYILVNDGLGWTDMWYNGHELFGVYPPLYHLLMAPLNMISFDLIRPISFALLGAVAFYSMYHYADRKLSKDRSIAAGLLFIMGYLLYIAHISGSMPQAFAIALAPAFYAELEESLEGKNPALAGIFGGAIVLFHHNAAIAIALGAAVLILFNWRKNMVNALSAGLLTVLVSAFWLVPALSRYSDATFSMLNDIAMRGMEDVVMLMPQFAAVVSLKFLVSLDAVKQHKQEAVLGLAALLLSTGFVAPITEHIPIISHLPPYRFYAVTAFATSFLAAAARKRILVAVLAVSLIISGSSLLYHDDAGFQSGQPEAYGYVGQLDTDLVYDAENTDLRAYAITIHGQDVADGWSIGSTSIRPGLMKFQEWSRIGDDRAVEFLQRWSAETVITYQDTELNRNLHEMLDRSELYSRDRCFDEVCVFRLEEPTNAVLSQNEDTYVVNASKDLPIPYSSRFNGTTHNTPDGFLGVNGTGTRTITYETGALPSLSAILSILTLAGAALIYRRDLNMPQTYSKRFRYKLGLCAE